MNVTLWPTKTSSSNTTPSQMKVWLEILQRAPIRAPFLDLDERADLDVVANLAPVEVGKTVNADALAQFHIRGDLLEGLCLGLEASSWQS